MIFGLVIAFFLTVSTHIFCMEFTPGGFKIYTEVGKEIEKRERKRAEKKIIKHIILKEIERERLKQSSIPSLTILQYFLGDSTVNNNLFSEKDKYLYDSTKYLFKSRQRRYFDIKYSIGLYSPYPWERKYYQRGSNYLNFNQLVEDESSDSMEKVD